MLGPIGPLILLGRKLWEDDSEAEVTCLPPCDMLRTAPKVGFELERLLNIGSSNFCLDCDYLAFEHSRLLPVLALVAVIVCMR